MKNLYNKNYLIECCKQMYSQIGGYIFTLVTGAKIIFNTANNKDVIKKMNTVTQVQSVGFGFVAIKTGVFERMERPWFAHMLQNIVNSRGDKLPDALGEDISWCVRAYKAGIPIYFDPSVLVNHTKTVEIDWR
jgi:hypothetical protein